MCSADEARSLLILQSRECGIWSVLVQVCGLKPGELVHMLGDAHVYKNHVDALEEQLQNKPRPFPKLFINPDVKSIDAFRIEDMEMQDYHPHKRITMKMAV